MTTGVPASAVIAAARPGHRRDPTPAIMLALVGLVCLVIAIHLVGIAWISLHEGGFGGKEATLSLGNFTRLMSRPATWTVLANTLEFSVYTLIVAFLFGLPFAWLAERTDLPGRPILFGLMTIGLLNPGFTTAMGWLFLIHPRIGVANKWLVEVLGLPSAPFDVTTVAGMGWVQGLNLAPLAFIMTAATFRAMDPALEEAAAMCRAGVLQRLGRITLRLAWPGILAAGIYIFMIGFAAFDVPAIIGWTNRIYTFSTYAVSLLGSESGLPQYGPVAALSAPVILIALGFGWLYNRMQGRARKYAVVTGKGYRPRLVALGQWKGAAWVFIALYACLGTLLPILMLVWASLLPYLQLPTASAFAALAFDNFRQISWDMLFRAVGNTAILMVLGATITVALSIASSWIVLRTAIRGRAAIDFTLFLPHVVPNVVFGVAALLLTLFVIDRIVPIYGTIWVLLLVFVIGRISYGTRMTNAGLIQIHPELMESARISGARTAATLFRVVVPLMLPTLIYAWMWVALLCYRELTLAVVLTTGKNLTFPVMIWNSWYDGRVGIAAAQSLIMLAALLPLIGLYWLLADRRLRVRGDG